MHDIWTQRGGKDPWPGKTFFYFRVRGEIAEEGWDEMRFTSYEIYFSATLGFCYWPSPEFCGLEM